MATPVAPTSPDKNRDRCQFLRQCTCLSTEPAGRPSRLRARAVETCDRRVHVTLRTPNCDASVLERRAGQMVSWPAMRERSTPIQRICRLTSRRAGGSRPSRSEDGIRQPLRGLLALALILFSACVRSDEGSRTPEPAGDDPRLRGSVLVANGFFQGGLSVIELPDGEPQPVPMPESRPVQAGFFLEDGSVVAVLSQGGGALQAYRSSSDDEPVALGGELDGVFTFSLAGEVLLAADCAAARPSVYVVNVVSPTDWQRVEGACSAALSPDGTSFVWQRDGRHLIETTIAPTTEPRTLLDVTQIEERPPGMSGDLTTGGELRWGEPGLALSVETGDRQAALVVGAQGEVAIAPLGPQGAGLRPTFAWQPGGDLLAISSWSNIEGVIRVFDPGTDETRVVGLQADPYNGVVWSPDGDVLLAASDSWWTFVTPDGTWIRSIPVGRGSSLPLAWRP